VPALADFTARVAEVLQVRDVVLVGTSLGGHILGQLALQRLAQTVTPSTSGLQPRGLMLIGALGLFPLEPSVAAAICRSVKETSADAIQRKVAFVMKIQDGITPGWLREEYLINNSAGARESFERLGAYLVDQPASDIIGPRLAAPAPLASVGGVGRAGRGGAGAYWPGWTSPTRSARADAHCRCRPCALLGVRRRVQSLADGLRGSVLRIGWARLTWTRPSYW
jgi:pimeloyl-ACP methyl ester carboxylesterase